MVYFESQPHNVLVFALSKDLAFLIDQLLSLKSSQGMDNRNAAAPEGDTNRTFAPTMSLGDAMSYLLTSNRYDDVQLIISKPSRDDWKDKEWSGKDVLNLRRLSNEEIVELGEIAIPSLCKGPSLQSIAAIFVLAYNLKDHEEVNFFGTIPFEFRLPHLVHNMEELGDAPLKSVAATLEPKIHYNPRDKKSMKMAAISICFVVASYLRLYAKSAENYSLVGNHIAARFGNFYNFPLQVEHFHPTIESIRTIKSALEMRSLFKNTLYNILYAGESVAAGKNLKNFLYAIHLEYTGMHPYTLFIRAMDASKISNVDLMKAIYIKKFQRELDAIQKIFNTLMDNTSSDYRLQMWKYARIFDPTFLSELQTKNCQFFTLMLAYMLKTIAPAENARILDIAQLQEAPTLFHSKALAYALKVLKVLNAEFEISAE